MTVLDKIPAQKTRTAPFPPPTSVAVSPEAHFAPPAPTAMPAPNPAMIGLPTFIAGSVVLGLMLTGYVPAQSQGAAIPVILMAAGLGSLIATFWAMRLGESMVAGIYGTFTGFWLSYAALVLGLTHNWFGVARADMASTSEMFLISWLVVIAVVAMASLTLPWVYSLLFWLIELSLALSLAGALTESTTTTKVAGYVVLAFTAVGVYLFGNASLEATGRPGLPLGKPLLNR